MQARNKRNIKPGYEYDKLFPKSEGDTKTIRRDANVHHTVEFIPKVAQETLVQTKKISELLKGKTVYETCSNIWHFVYGHINYKKDLEGYEQIRSPARAWHDRKQGVDCDCYSVFISSVLTNLNIPHILRITKYHRDYFQHIYPVVPTSPLTPLRGRGEKEIVIDCVTDRFDYEVPYSEKKDYPMDLQYLNGFDGDGIGELGKILKRNMAKNKKPVTTKKATPLLKKMKAKTIAPSPQTTTTASPAPVSVAKEKKDILKKVVSAVNKVNPATVLLRNGILSAMKLNIKNVAARLRWSYLPPQQVAAKNIDPAKFQKLIATRQKLEKIFQGAGGKIDNLKKAILGGKGNKDKAVNGLGMLPMIDTVNYISEYTPLNQLLGNEIYYSENVDGMEGFQGFGQLGEPVTLATIGAAMGVLAGIVAALKQIGDIFKSKTKSSEDFGEEKTDAPENNVSPNANDATIPSVVADPILPEQSSSISIKESSLTPDDNYTDESFLPVKTAASQSTTRNNMVLVHDELEKKSAATATENSVTDNNGDERDGFWEKNKKWLKPVAVGVGGLAIIAIGYKILKSDKTQNKSSPGMAGLSGVPYKKKKNKKHNRKFNQYKKAVALL